MVRFICQHCGYHREVGDEHRGETGRCPKCRATTPIGTIRVHENLQPELEHGVEFNTWPISQQPSSPAVPRESIDSISESLSSIADSLWVVRITCEILWFFWAIAVLGWMVIWLLA